MSKICCLFNYNPLYRLPIYKAMSSEFGCDFFFGDSVFEPIRQFDVAELKGFRGFLHAVRTRFKGYVWYKGVSKVFRREYSHYILTGENLLIANWLVILWARLTGRKVIMWTHGVSVHYDKWTTVMVLKAFYRSADVLLLYGRHNRKHMLELGCREAGMFTIHNSLDTPRQTMLYERMSPSPLYQDHFGNNHPTVIYIGRLQRRKKVEQLIDAAALLAQRGTPVNVVLVGNSTDADYLRDIVVERGMESMVWFYGPSYDEEENACLLYNANVCVCPAAVGLTAIHALSYGCPVVSNDNTVTQMPEFESIREGVTGSLFREDDIADLADKIHQWCVISSQQRNEVRQAARRDVIEEWSVDYQISVLKEVLK